MELPPAMLPTTLGAVRIILVDDQVFIRELMADFLTREPRFHIVEEVEGVKQAIVACRERQPDLVVLNFTLPRMSGIEAVPLLRRAAPRTRILMCSVSIGEALVVVALRAEPDGYIEMTHSGKEVREAVAAVADGRRYFCQRTTRLLQTLQAQGRRAGPEPTLSPREKEILRLVAVGKSNKEVATRLKVSVSTVRVHRANLMRKLRLHSAVDLTRHAMRQGLVSTS